MPSINDIHYVKFIRGPLSAWEILLQTPSKISDDTLYFIYENAANPKKGKLYLGQKLISGDGTSIENINIEDIGNININNESLVNKQILVYNESTEQWENTSLSTIINTAVGEMVGATAAAAGASGLVPAPQAGDQNKFLRGDKTWANVNIPSFDSDIFGLNNNNEVTLNGFNLAPVGSIPIKTNNGIEWSTSQIGRLKREITTLEKLQAQLNGTDPDPIDEDTIYMVLKNNNNDINKYDEYMIINNRLELLGTFGEVNLNNYVQNIVYEAEIEKLENLLYDQEDDQTHELIPGLVSRVVYLEQNYVSKSQIGDLNQLLLSTGNSNLVEEVNTLHNNILTLEEQLKWQELEEEND